MNDLISIENLINAAKAKGIDFGKGDPYNRLRYYTKIGWLPHMIRKKDDTGNIRGHYQTWSVERLIQIEEMKAKGATNEEISKKLKVTNKWQDAAAFLFSKEIRTQLIAVLSLVILLLILANELGVIKLGKSKADLEVFANNSNTKQVLDSGTVFVPRGQKKVFVATNAVKNTSKVYVTFTQEYSPASRFWVADVKEYSGFTLELDTQVFNNAEFNWWVTN